MAYKVINRFKDTKDENTVYQVGEKYPKTNHKPSKERIEELTNKHPKYGRAFIQEVEESEITEKLTADEVKKMNKAEQEAKIIELGGNPKEASNESERIDLILKLQEQIQPPSDK